MPLTVRAISEEEHLGLLASRPSASFLQCPSWGRVKREWRSESIGWYDEPGALVGAGLVLYRQVPKLAKYLAYLPEAPVIDWAADDLGAWLGPMVGHLQSEGAFGGKMGPPVPVRRWRADTVKGAIAAKSAKCLVDVPADETDPVGERVAASLHRLGWRPPADEGGFA